MAPLSSPAGVSLLNSYSVRRTRVYRALGRFEEALTLQESLLAEYESWGLPAYGYVYEELAELLHRTGDPRARRFFRLAHEALSDDVWMVNSQPERLREAGPAHRRSLRARQAAPSISNTLVEPLRAILPRNDPATKAAEPAAEPSAATRNLFR